MFVDEPPLYVPLIFAAFGVLMWFRSMRPMLRDPEGQLRKAAQKRARLFRSDEDAEFDQLWRGRWMYWVVFAVYCFVVLITLSAAIKAAR
jgi:hypothetical protein